MARQAKSPAASVVDFFRNAPLETVQTVHEIVHGIVKERSGPATVAKKKPGRPAGSKAVTSQVTETQPGV